MKKYLIILIVTLTILTSFGGLIIISVAIGNHIGKEIEARQYQTLELDKSVINNYIYAQRYRNLLKKMLNKYGYVSLERLVFYMQRTYNILDITELSDIEWEKAYLENIDLKYNQMIPIKTICKNFKISNIPEYTIETGKNKNGVLIERLNLCIVNNEDITLSNDYSETLIELPYVFPFSSDVYYSITSIVFENRNVSFDISDNLQNIVNYHSGWDFAVPIGTNFKSICDGKITAIVMTQPNDVPFDEQEGIKNQTGNYVYVECDNGYIAQYLHIKYNSLYNNYKIGDIVHKGDLLGKTSTTGLSTGPHLHLGLKTQEGKQIDALNYMQFGEILK